MSSTAPQSDSSYLLRKLHSLFGIVPVGAFLAEHFWSNSAILVSPEKCDAVSRELQTIPFRPFVEWAIIFHPMLYHGGYGIYIWLRGNSNVSFYPWVKNWLYTLQRCTGLIAFDYIAWHLYTERWLTHGHSTYESVTHDLSDPLFFSPRLAPGLNTFRSSLLLLYLPLSSLKEKSMHRFLRIASVCLLGALFMTATTSAQSNPVSDKAKKLQSSSIVIDTHDDTTQRLLDPTFDISVPHTDGNIDLPRMRDGGMTAIFFSIWISGKIMGPEAVKQAIDQIDAVRETVRKRPDSMILATSAEDIREAKKQRKIAALMGVEGGHMMGNDLSVLRTFAVLGVRYMTLTHMENNEWADSSTAKPEHNGLTPFGKQVIQEMNRLGMIVDISHVADKTFYDALETSKAPVFASHSSCRAICNAARNMTDDMIRDLAKHGGVIQINYHVGFLSQEFRDYEAAHPDVEKAITEEVNKKCGDNEACKLTAGDQAVRDFMKEGKLPKVDWTTIVEHIDHAVKIGGIDHVGLGSDFDGAVMPIGMEDATHLPQITDALLKKGYSESDIKKILGENTLRVLSEVQKVSRDLNK
jgi:membrane dipeptidase